jgi:AraC-like DNA-binding protein
MKSVAPSAQLAPFVRDFVVVEVRDETTRVRLPELGLVLGVRFRGSASVLAGGVPARLPAATLTGMASTARRMRTAAGSGIILARFHPGGAAQFFDEPLHELLDTSLALDQILPRSEVDRVSSRVMEANGDAARVTALEALLLARLRPSPPDPIVAGAVRALRAAHGALPIGELARTLGISQDPLEKRFRRSVGVSPKRLASLLRLHGALDAYRPGVRLTQLAVDAGYFDQSHFNREVRAVTGEPPGQLFRGGEYR